MIGHANENDWWVRDEERKQPPNEQTTHPQYPDGFPARENDDLLGHWQTPQGVVVVEHHPHGYEVHLGPCYDFENCDACAPDRGPMNPYTSDGHCFRECPAHGVILNVAGDAGRTVLEYLAGKGSAPHIVELAKLRTAEADAELEYRRRTREEHEKQLADQVADQPSPAERLAALEAELKVLADEIRQGRVR